MKREDYIKNIDKQKPNQMAIGFKLFNKYFKQINEINNNLFKFNHNCYNHLKRDFVIKCFVYFLCNKTLGHII